MAPPHSQARPVPGPPGSFWATPPRSLSPPSKKKLPGEPEPSSLVHLGPGFLMVKGAPHTALPRATLTHLGYTPVSFEGCTIRHRPIPKIKKKKPGIKAHIEGTQSKLAAESKLVLGCLVPTILASLSLPAHMHKKSPTQAPARVPFPQAWNTHKIDQTAPPHPPPTHTYTCHQALHGNLWCLALAPPMFVVSVF